MSDVIDLDSKRNENRPHTSGPVVCLACRHRWIAVCPVGTIGLECPECRLLRGVHEYQVMPENGIIWACGCGNNLFFVTAKGNALCPNCGQHQRIPEC